MTYSNELYKNRPSLFPPPPRWLAWIEQTEGIKRQDPITGRWIYERIATGEGKVRHHDTIQTAKKNVTWIGRVETPGADATFMLDWTIYEWVPEQEKYVVRFSGKKGEVKKQNPLFIKGVVPSKKNSPIQKLKDEEVDAALASIMGQGLLT